LIYKNGFKFVESKEKPATMKKILLFLFIVSAGLVVNAQDLAPDQNPNYKTSLAKYTASHDNLQTTLNTTVQSTYKAYDWRTAKNERKAERITYRRERNLFNNNYNYGYDSRYYNNGYNFYYNDRYNRYRSPYQYRSYYGRRWHW
jgi:hypothetical protein